MALTIDSLAEPFEKFFIEKFKNQESQQKFENVFFCFDTLEKSASGENFLDNPEDPTSYNELKAKSFFATEVNKIPEISEPFVMFKEDSIGDFYITNIVNLSQPYVGHINNETTKESLITNFVRLKSSINRTYGECMLPFSELPIRKLFSFALPEKWYDTRINGNWTAHSIEVSETTVTKTGRPRTKQNLDLWRKIANPEILLKTIDNQTTKPLPKSVNTSLSNVSKKSMAAVLKISAVRDDPESDGLADPVRIVAPLMLNPILLNTPKVKVKPALQTKFTQLIDFNPSARVLASAILNNTTTSEVTTKRITLSFKWQLVRIDRPWLSMTFLNQDNWFIFNKAKAEISQGEFPALPIAFVAIKDLVIKGQWSQEDIKNSKESYGFGPFIFTKETFIENGVIESKGVHISGWIFQKMPSLPPLQPPAIP